MHLLGLSSFHSFASPVDGAGDGGAGLSRAAAGDDDWPEPLAEEAFHGIAGEVVRFLEPHTEAGAAALLVNFLVGIGNLIGRGPHARADGARHGLNLFAILVGETAKGRKGTSWSQVHDLFGQIDPLWTGGHVNHGLSSGEGLIWSVRDPVEKRRQIKDLRTGRMTAELETVIEDEGILDKRMVVVEGEFASVLKVMGREGNNLSPLIRLAWDGGKLQVMTRTNPATAIDAHISLLGHITRQELLRHFSETEAANGFGNRFLWIMTKRSKLLPEGGGALEVGPLVRRLNAALAAAASLERLARDEAARCVWAAVYPALSEGLPGMLGAVTSRGEAQVLRLSTLYAVLDGSREIQVPHLLAALAVWEYAAASARYIFGASSGDAVADQILTILRQTPGGLTLIELHERFHRNIPAARLQRALKSLAGTVRCERRGTHGRPAEAWLAVPAAGATAAGPSLLELAWNAVAEFARHRPVPGLPADRAAAGTPVTGEANE